MDVITYTAARNRLAKTMDKVNDDGTPVLITRQSGRPAVLMSLEDFNAYEETAHLLSTRQPWFQQTVRWENVVCPRKDV